MALRREFALGHSELNEFLFAIVGEEKSGQRLTVLSALARQGFEPWGEAARLAGLSKDAATRTLAAVIGSLPEGDWTVAEVPSIASRLIDYLPRGSSTSGGPLPGSAAAARKSKLGVPRWMMWVALAAAIMVAAAHFNAARAVPSDAGAASSNRSHVAGVASFAVPENTAAIRLDSH